MKYCSLQHWTLLLPPYISTTEHHFCFGPDTSFFLELLEIALCSSPVTYWTVSELEDSSSGVLSFCLFIIFKKFSGKNTGMHCYFFLQWTMFCQNSSLWPTYLEWHCIAWLIASLSYVSQFAKTRLWFMKGNTEISKSLSNIIIWLLIEWYSPGSNLFMEQAVYVK